MGGPRSSQGALPRAAAVAAGAAATDAAARSSSDAGVSFLEEEGRLGQS